MIDKVICKVLLISVLLLSLNSCLFLLDDIDDWDDDDLSSGSAEFVGLYAPGDEKMFGESQCIVKFAGSNGEASYNKAFDIYPPNSILKDYCMIKGNKMVMGHHHDFVENKSETAGYYDLKSDKVIDLPCVEPTQADDYGTIVPSTVKLSNSGHVFYISATNDMNYGDEYRPYLMRYNPSTGVLDKAMSATEFVKSQPEKGWDTEAATIDGALFPAENGRYVFGTVYGYGVDGGAIHTDFKVMFKYDFNNQEYERVAAGYGEVTIIGISSDARNILFRSFSLIDGGVKLFTYNTETDQVNELYNVWNSPYTMSSWNTNGFCSGGDGSTSNKLAFFDFTVPELRILNSSGWDRKRKSQFSGSGDFVYFCIEGGAENYMCKTADTEEGSTIDTLFTYSKEIIDWLIVK